MSTHNPPVRNAQGNRKPMPTGGGTTMAPPKSSSGNNSNSTENAEQETLQNDPFSVEFGQHTFDAEGNENPKSGSFTRKVHWPEKENSGVTIGRGYDMGQKSQSQIFRDMTAAGIDTKKARMISLAAGKTGEDAQKYVQDYRDRIGEITPEQQKALFEITYAKVKEDAEGRATKFDSFHFERNKQFILTQEQWDGLSVTIHEYITDLTYRGDYKNKGYAGYPNINPILQSEASNEEKIKRLIAIEEKRKATTKESHIRVRCDDRINLLKSGLGGSAAKPAEKRIQTTSPASSTGPAPALAEASNQPETYTVKTGETITGIAAKLGVSAEALKAKNKVYSTGNVEYFLSGQVLLIPAGDSAPSSNGRNIDLENQGANTHFGAGQQIEGKTGEFPISGALPASPAPGPSGLLAEPPQPISNQSQELTEEPAKEQRVPPGRIIGGDVGIGGENHPEDVKAVMGRLLALQVINLREARQQDETHLGQYIIRYQKRVFSSYTDGLVEKGGKTETHLINLNKGRMKAIRPETPGGNPQTNSNQPDPAKERKEASEAKQSQQGQDIDYDGLARKLHIALRGDLFGGGKNPEGALNALKAAKPTARQAEKLATVYMVKYGRNLALDVKVVYSENGGGSGLDAFWEALGVGGQEGSSEPKRKAKKPLKADESPKKEISSSESGEVEIVHQIIDPEDWRTQNKNVREENKKWRDIEKDGQSCKFIAEKMVYRHLYSDLPDDFQREDVIKDGSGKYHLVVGSMGKGEYLSIQREDKSKYKDIESGVFQQSTFETQSTAPTALLYLDSYLDQGIPVVVGVDHTFNRNLHGEGGTTGKKTKGYNEGSTDHYIVAVGKGIDDQGRKYYEFYDSGTQYQNSGANANANRLVEETPGQFTCKQPWSSKIYTLTCVMIFEKDRKKFSDVISENKTIEAKLASDFDNKKGDFAQ